MVIIGTVVAFGNKIRTFISQVFDFQKKFNYSIQNISGEKITMEKIIELKEESTRTIWYPN